jgi:hypothetical protein
MWIRSHLCGSESGHLAFSRILILRHRMLYFAKITWKNCLDYSIVFNNSKLFTRKLRFSHETRIRIQISFGMWIRIRIQQLILLPNQTDNPGYCYTFNFLLQFRFVFLEAYSIKGLTYWDLTHLVPRLRHGLWSYSATLLLPPFLQTPALHESNKPNGVLTYITASPQ